MTLLLGLDVVEDLPQGRLSELKYAGIVKPRCVLFGGQKVRAEVAIVSLFLGICHAVGRGKALPLAYGRCASRHGGCVARLNGGEGVVVPLLGVGNLGKEGLELSVRRWHSGDICPRKAFPDP